MSQVPMAYDVEFTFGLSHAILLMVGDGVFSWDFRSFSEGFSPILSEPMPDDADEKRYLHFHNIFVGTHDAHGKRW